MLQKVESRLWFQIVLVVISLVVLTQTQFVSQNCSLAPISQCPTLPECDVYRASYCENNTGGIEYCAPRWCALEDSSICAVWIGQSSNTTNETPIYQLFGIQTNCTTEALPLGWDVVGPENCICTQTTTPAKNIGIRLIPIFVLIVVVFFLVYPIEVPFPKALVEKLKLKSIPKFPFDFATVPVAGVLVLLAAGCISGTDLLFGIIGNGKIIPYAIILTFFSLVYTCMSLEITGIFDYISIKTINSTKGSGVKLFFSVWALTSILTLSTSNDIAILTLTPIICSLTQYTGTKVTPFLFLQFFMANIWSMTLMIGNPTNIIVSTAFKIGFAEYCHYMSLVALVCAPSCLLIVYLRFRNQIPETISMPEQDAEECWRDKGGAIYGLVCLFCCICLLISSSWLGFPIYSITLSVAFLMFMKDIAFDFLPYAFGNTNCYQIIGKCFKKQPEVFSESELNNSANKGENKDENKDNNQENLESPRSPRDDLESPRELESPRSPRDDLETPRECKESPPETSIKRFQCVKVLMRLPWKIIFFLFSVFVIVKALQVADWTSDIARGLSLAIGPEESMTNTVIAVYLLGTVSVVCCNILNNQPMTILFTTVLQESSFVVSPSSRQGAMYALIMGSNLGANFTLIGALAGIMWSAICKRRSQEIKPLSFIKVGLTVMPFVLAIGCGILCLELLFYPKN